MNIIPVISSPSVTPRVGINLNSWGNSENAIDRNAIVTQPKETTDHEPL
jgi:hypothetical protein